MKTLRYGILSTASIVPRFINAMRAEGCGEILAVASRNMETAKAFAEKYQIPKSYGSYEELLADPEIDVVYIAMINSLHYTYAKKALEAGKHVICEKPFTLRTEEAEELFALAKEKGLFITEALKTVFLPVFEDIKNLINDGCLGNIHLVDFTSSCAATYNTWLHSHQAGGGALYGNAGYCIGILHMLFGEISSYNGLATFGNSEVEEQCVLNMEIDQKILAVSKISTNVLAQNRALIFGDKGYIEIPNYWKADRAVIHYNNGKTVSIEHPCQYELRYEIAHFHECICQGLTESPITTKSHTLNSLKIIESLADNWRNAK